VLSGFEGSQWTVTITPHDWVNVTALKYVTGGGDRAGKIELDLTKDVVLSAVPEPAFAGLAIPALMVLAMRRRR
jgi:hypothetical protein